MNTSYKDIFKKKCLKIQKKWENIIKYKPLNKLFIILPKDLISFTFLILSIITIYKYYINNVSNTGVVYYNVPTENYTEIKEKTKIKLPSIDYEGKYDKICFKIASDKDDTKIVLQSTKIKKVTKAYKTNKYGYICYNMKNINNKTLKEESYYLSSTKEIKIYKDNDNNIAIQLNRVQNKNLQKVTIGGIITILTVFFTINYIINTKKVTEEKFLLILLPYLIILLFIFPPFQVPDEVAHFYRSYNFSQPEINNGIKFGKKTLTVPNNIECVDYANIHNSNKVYQTEEITECTKNVKNKQITNIEKTGSQILGYITQSIGIKIADIFTNSSLVIFFAGRLLTLIISFVITYHAIKIAPKHKLIILTASTMMMALQQMISYSYDSILNAMCILLISYILKLIYQKEQITYKNLIIPTISLIYISNIKMVYLPLALLLLLIPKHKFKNRKERLVFLIALIILVLTIPKIIDILFSLPSNSNSNSAKQLKYLLNNPLDIIKIAIKTIEKKGLFYIESMTGYFGWFMIKTSKIYIYAYLLLYIYIINGEKSIIRKKHIIITSIATTTIAIFGALYIVWSKYRLSYVEGVQGRYLLPLIIPLCLVFIPKQNKYQINKTIVYSIINIIMYQFLLVILLTYY